MIAAVPKSQPAAGSTAVPSVLAALGRDFASLFPAAKDDAHLAGDRQAKVASGKDLPDDDGVAGVRMPPIAILVPSQLPHDMLPTTAAGIIPLAPNPSAAGAAPLAVAALPVVGTPSAPAPVIAQPAAAAPALEAPGDGAASPPANALMTVIASKSPAAVETPVAKPADDTPRSAIRPGSQVPPVKSEAIVTQQAIAVMADRPPPLVQGLIATVRGAVERPASPSSPTAEHTRAGEPRSDALTATPVAAAPIETHRNMLDLRQEHWPQRMVDHIAALRDAADANDTRIRLVPDALGTIDVQLRREGETVHVGFTADRTETRALLDQAQPKLAELGEARGLRFAHSGTGQGGQHAPRHAHEPRLPSAPARAITETETADGIDAARLA